MSYNASINSWDAQADDWTHQSGIQLYPNMLQAISPRHISLNSGLSFPTDLSDGLPEVSTDLALPKSLASTACDTSFTSIQDQTPLWIGFENFTSVPKLKYPTSTSFFVAPSNSQEEFSRPLFHRQDMAPAARRRQQACISGPARIRSINVGLNAQAGPGDYMLSMGLGQKPWNISPSGRKTTERPPSKTEKQSSKIRKVQHSSARRLLPRLPPVAAAVVPPPTVVDNTVPEVVLAAPVVLAPMLSPLSPVPAPSELNLPSLFAFNGAFELDRAASSSTTPPPAPAPRLPNGKRLCTECTAYPDGFRGEHELRRHRERKHQTSRKIYVIVDPDHPPAAAAGGASSAFYSAADPIPSQSRLYNCLTCAQSKPYYNVHNAAAHLRRMHFCVPKAERVKSKRLAQGEKPVGVHKQTVADKKRESQRASDPPLVVCMKWIKEVKSEVDLKAEKEAEDAAERRRAEYRDNMLAQLAREKAERKSMKQLKVPSLPSVGASLKLLPPLEPIAVALKDVKDAWEVGPVPDDWELNFGAELLKYNQSVPD